MLLDAPPPMSFPADSTAFDALLLSASAKPRCSNIPIHATIDIHHVFYEVSPVRELKTSPKN